MSVKKVKAALTRKIGPLPAWVYLAALFAGVYYWRHRNAAAASAAVATGSAAGVGSGAGTGTSGYGSASGGDSGGGGGDSSSEPPTTGVGAPVSWDPTQAAPSGPQGVRDPDPATTSSAPAPATRAPLGRGASQPFATSAGRLQWGGQTFTTQAQFQEWARKHGTTVRAELAKHPEAQRLYDSLAHPAKPPKSTVGTPAHAIATRTRTTTAKPAGRPAARPVSVRQTAKPKPAAPAPHAAHPLLTSSRTPSTSKNAGAAHTAAPKHAPTPAAHPTPVPPPAQTAHEHHETPAAPPKKPAAPKKKQAKHHAPAV